MMMYELYVCLKKNHKWLKILTTDKLEDCYRVKDIYKTTVFYKENCYKDRYCIVTVNTDEEKLQQEA